VKRRRLLQHLVQNGCEILDEGGNHTRVRNRLNGLRSFVPRHREIKPNLVQAICKQLNIAVPAER
jgi:mRNA interferase HicA